MQKDKTFFKVTCEQVTPLEKEILLDINCGTIDDIRDIMSRHPEHIQQNKAWIIYPMSAKVVTTI